MKKRLSSATKQGQTSIYFSPEEKEALRKRITELDTSISTWVRLLVRAELGLDSKPDQFSIGIINRL